MKFQRLGIYKGLVAATLIGTVCNSAIAADKELLDILLGNGAITEAQYQDLLAKEELKKADVAQINFSNGSGLEIKSGDGRYEVEIGGRLQMEYVNHSYDSRMGDKPISGTQVRRGRIEMDGKFDQNWKWAAEFDFAKNKVSLKDFKFGYAADNGAEIYVGHQKQPYSLSLEMSSNDIPFVERSIDNFLVAALTDRAIGIRAEGQGEHWFAAGGVFGEAFKTGAPGEEGWGTSGRLVYSPIIEDNSVVHLGIRAAYREFDDSSPSVSFKDKTTDFSDFSIVNTGTLANAESASMFGPEFAMSYGPLYVFGEYTAAEVDRQGDTSLDFSSWHVAAAWSLTGESRASRYRIDEGEFKSIRPASPFSLENGGRGAWEIAARYATIDLNDSNVAGGEEDALSIGLNWYLNRNMRIMADWTHVLDTDDTNQIRRFAEDMDIFTLRSQWNY